MWVLYIYIAPSVGNILSFLIVMSYDVISHWHRPNLWTVPLGNFHKYFRCMWFPICVGELPEKGLLVEVQLLNTDYKPGLICVWAWGRWPRGLNSCPRHIALHYPANCPLINPKCYLKHFLFVPNKQMWRINVSDNWTNFSFCLSWLVQEERNK